MASNGQRDPGFKLVCDADHGEIRLTFPSIKQDGSQGALRTYTLTSVPPFGTLRRLQENAEQIAKKSRGARVGFDAMVATLEWWRDAAQSLGVVLPPVDELPIGLSLLGPQQEALVHWLVCSVPTLASGPQNGAQRPPRAPRDRAPAKRAR